MYLHKTTYIGNSNKEQKDQVKIEIPGIKQERVKYIVEEIAYWRKANAIHSWFVRNVQDGVDDCKAYYVERGSLRQLYETCQAVRADHSLAAALLPTLEGFFFGSTDYGSDYFYDLDQTVEVLAPILEEEEAGDFEYRSSW